ncbi:hypothetical protein LIER_27972 [Lithospermum erythrorhizon]|uniref:Uncharacterized protein n=1 Tax=Lithospermum erythrorhizon TaxID=34254 RepID=A0AAV3RGX7_LITER
MERTKRTTKRLLPPPKRAKAAGGVKYACPSPPASPSTFARLVTGVLSPKSSQDRAMHDALLDQGIMHRMASLGLGRLYFACAARWTHPSVPADPRPARGASPGALQAGCIRVGATGPPRSGQQLPLGHGFEGPCTSEGPSGERSCQPSCLHRLPGEGRPSMPGGVAASVPLSYRTLS